MRLLFVGDVIGKPGRRAVQNILPRLVDHHRTDYVVVNENGKLDESVDAVKAIITAERLRVKQRRVVL